MLPVFIVTPHDWEQVWDILLQQLFKKKYTKEHISYHAVVFLPARQYSVAFLVNIKILGSLWSSNIFKY